MTIKTIKYIAIFLTGFLFIWGCEEFFRREIGGFAGSYPFLEYWDIKASEQEIVDAIKELSKTNPNFQTPKQFEFISSRDTGYIWTSSEMQEYLNKRVTDSLIPLPEKNYNNYYHEYWLHINLYYPDTKEVVQTWTRPVFDTTMTTFAFVSLTKIDEPVAPKLINRDFWYIANKREISKFKKTFVDKIQEQIYKKRKIGT
jgi:hypothetical protein